MFCFTVAWFLIIVDDKQQCSLITLMFYLIIYKKLNNCEISLTTWNNKNEWEEQTVGLNNYKFLGQKCPLKFRNNSKSLQKVTELNLNSVESSIPQWLGVYDITDFFAQTNISAKNHLYALNFFRLFLRLRKRKGGKSVGPLFFVMFSNWCFCQHVSYSCTRSWQYMYIYTYTVFKLIFQDSDTG